MTDSICQATPDHLDQLAQIFDVSRRFCGQQSDIIVARQSLSDRLSRNGSVVLVAHNGGEAMVGLVQLYPTFSSILAAPMYLLSDLFVVPEARRRGIGTRLLTSASEAARVNGAVCLE